MSASTKTGRLDGNAAYSRRAILRRMAGVGVAALAVGAFGAVVARPAGATTTATTTTALNPRAGPSTSHQVLGVMAGGSRRRLVGPGTTRGRRRR